MKQCFKLKLKTWLVFFSMLVISLLLSSGIVFWQFRDNIKLVYADTSQNVSGWAWSENYGWISFNSNDCDSDDNGTTDTGNNLNCPAGLSSSAYGVNIDLNSGNFSGYAWSPNIGWIDFGPTSGYPGSPNTPVHYNSSTGAVTGWAKVLSLGDNGWFKMSGTWSNGVKIDNSGNFSGWAWNGNDDSTGVGWVSFGCSDGGANREDICSSYDYKTHYDNQIVAPTIISVEPTNSLKCSALTINWDYNTEAGTPSGFNIYRSDIAGNLGTKIYSDLNPGNRSQSDVGLNAGQTYYYTVSAVDGTTEKYSNQAAGTTLPFCDVSGISVVGKCPNIVNLSWDEKTNVDYYLVKRCDENESDCDNDNNYYPISSGDDCFESNNCVDSVCSCQNTSFEIDKENHSYRYKIAGVIDNDPDPDTIGDYSSKSDAVIPCVNLPTWTEVKPR